MNKQCFRIIFSKTLQRLVVVSELAKSEGKSTESSPSGQILQKIRHYVAVAQRFNRLKILRSPLGLPLNGDFYIMSLTSELVKLIETTYKERAIAAHQITQLEQQKANLDEKILSFEKTLMLSDPEFDLRRLKTQFDATKLVKFRPFKQNLQWLISKALRQNNQWRNLYSITNDVVRLDNPESSSISSTKAHELAVIRVIRELYKKGIVERREAQFFKSKKRRGFFMRSEWRLKMLEQE